MKILTEEERKLVSEVAKSYPPGHGLSYFSNKEVGAVDDAIAEFEKSGKEFGWPAIHLFSVRKNHKELFFITLTNCLADIIHDFLLLDLHSDYISILNVNPLKVSEAFAK